MKRLLPFTILLMFVCISNEIKGQPWELVRETENGQRLKAISFPDSLNGWMVGNKPGDNIGYIIHTSDGGESWSEQVSAINTYLVDLHFFNQDTGFILGSAGLQKTVNGGLEWTEINLEDLQSPYVSIDFVDSIGYLVSNYGTLLKSEDGGESWIEAPALESSSRYYNSINFINRDTGIVAGLYDRYHYALRTINGGETWDSLEIETPATTNDGEFLDICVIEDSIVYMTGRLGKVVKSVDFGETWAEMTRISLPSEDLLENTALYFQDADTGWVASTLMSKKAALIHRTNDGGQTWERELFFVQSPSVGIYDLVFAENGKGWACGDQSGLTLNGEVIFQGSGEYTEEPPTSVRPDLTTESTILWNDPNPFSSHTTIYVDLDQESMINLMVFTANGQLIEELHSGSLPSGKHSFNFNAGSHEPGIYFTILRKNGVTFSRKMLLSR